MLVAIQESKSGPLLLKLANAGQTAPPNWKQAGRGIALALGGLNDLPPLHVTQDVEQTVMSKLTLLTGRESRVPVKDRVEALLALGRVGDPRLGLEKPENWIWLPPGEFRMGSNDGHDDEKPIHKVTLTQGFHLSRFPVTNHDFKAFIEAGGYTKKEWWSEKGWAFCQKGKREAPNYWTDAQWNAPNQPVVGVSWYEADAFCCWMNTQRLSTDVTGPFRLPTEAEWEYAARGQEGRKYPWGNDEPTPERANYDQTGLNQTSPMGAFPLGASKEGVLDLAGNCWEWCGDWYGGYPKAAQVDPTGPTSGSSRVFRGGSWLSSGDGLRAAYRSYWTPGDRDGVVGFRVACGGSAGG